MEKESVIQQIEESFSEFATRAFFLGVLVCKSEIEKRITNIAVPPDGEVISTINPQTIEDAARAAFKQWEEAKLSENPSH
jgi:hypothetical protein